MTEEIETPEICEGFIAWHPEHGRKIAPKHSPDDVTFTDLCESEEYAWRNIIQKYSSQNNITDAFELKEAGWIIRGVIFKYFDVAKA